MQVGLGAKGWVGTIKKLKGHEPAQKRGKAPKIEKGMAAKKRAEVSIPVRAEFCCFGFLQSVLVVSSERGGIK